MPPRHHAKALDDFFAWQVDRGNGDCQPLSRQPCCLYGSQRDLRERDELSAHVERSCASCTPVYPDGKNSKGSGSSTIMPMLEGRIHRYSKSGVKWLPVQILAQSPFLQGFVNRLRDPHARVESRRGWAVVGGGLEQAAEP